jgi:hypothetical protein
MTRAYYSNGRKLTRPAIVAPAGSNRSGTTFRSRLGYCLTIGVLNAISVKLAKSEILSLTCRPRSSVWGGVEVVSSSYDIYDGSAENDAPRTAKVDSKEITLWFSPNTLASAGSRLDGLKTPVAQRRGHRGRSARGHVHDMSRGLPSAVYGAAWCDSCRNLGLPELGWQYFANRWT